MTTPADTPSGPAAGPQIDAEPSQPATGPDTAATFAEAFMAPDTGEPSAEDYAAYTDDTEPDTEPGDDLGDLGPDATWEDVCALRQQIAGKCGLPQALHHRVLGETAEQIAADVAELLALAGPGDGEPASQREAGYRRKLRDTEAERDQLQGTVAALQRAQTAQAITAHGIKPDAVWAVTELGDLLDDTGIPDPRKIADAVALARDQLGIVTRAPSADRLKSGASQPAAPSPSGWQRAFGPRPRD
jgi:hypothetical protein